MSQELLESGNLEETLNQLSKIPLTVSVEPLSNVERKLAVEIPWDHVKGRLDDAYRELGNGVSIKGFRKGKVPRKMLEQMFSKHVNKEVSQRLVQESLVKALTDKQLTPVAEPNLKYDDLNEGAAFAYSAVVQVLPEIEPKDYFGAKVTQRPPKVTDEEIEQELKTMQRDATEFRPVEGRSTRAGDVLLIEILGKVNGEPYSMDRRLIDLEEPKSEPLPGLIEKLKGLAPEQKEVDVELEFPMHQHEPNEPCPGDEKMAKAKLLVTIHDVKEKSVPALDDEFAKDTGDAQTLNELKEVIRKKLLSADEKRARSETQKVLLDEILKQNEVPAVPALVEKELERNVQFRSLLFRQFGMEDPQDPNAQTEMRDDAEKMVKTALLLNAIAKKENVDVVDADVDKKFEEMAAQNGQNAAKLRSEYEKKGRMDGLREQIREEKTLDLLWSKATITVAEPAEPSRIIKP